MIVSLHPGQRISMPGPVPQRRRVIIIGATEAGVSATYHLGESALLLEQRDESNTAQRKSTNAEMRWGIRATAIHVYERRVVVSTGESFVYDKVVSTLRTNELLRLIVDRLPVRVQGVESLRYWLNGRDVELLDTATQLSCGEVDGQAAGKRLAEGIQRAMAAKYSNKALFQPRLVGGASPV
jgi:hypothetical protein